MSNSLTKAPFPPNNSQPIAPTLPGPPAPLPRRARPVPPKTPVNTDSPPPLTPPSGLEDTQDLANLTDDAVDFYQPANSQELFVVERIALAELAVLRAARFEAAILSASLGQAAPDLVAQRIAANSNALSLSIRYSAHAERQYRRAVEDF